jgi:hypothetical protein
MEMGRETGQYSAHVAWEEVFFCVSILKVQSSQFKIKAMGVPMVLLATKELLYSALKGGGGEEAGQVSLGFKMSQQYVLLYIYKIHCIGLANMV